MSLAIFEYRSKGGSWFIDDDEDLVRTDVEHEPERSHDFMGTHMVKGSRKFRVVNYQILLRLKV